MSREGISVDGNRCVNQDPGEGEDPEEPVLLVYEDDSQRAHELASKLKARGIPASARGTVVTVKKEPV